MMKLSIDEDISKMTQLQKVRASAISRENERNEKSGKPSIRRFYNAKLDMQFGAKNSKRRLESREYFRTSLLRNYLLSGIGEVPAIGRGSDGMS
ncbi:hypothetical protein SUGI_0235390 [Cryptomeria japonica]|nr:hypothetical protein SUGI_0235390 [Cryptomeria japonica]